MDHNLNLSSVLQEVQHAARDPRYWLGAALAYFVLSTLYLVTLHPLADVPGPRLAKVSDVWKAYQTRNGTYVRALRRAHERWGDTVRIGPNEVSVVAPEDVKTLYGHGTKWVKGPFYPAWSIGEPGHFSHTDPALHATGRRAVAAAYSTNHLLGLEHFADQNTAKLFGYLDRAAKKGLGCDVTQLIEWFAYDTVSEMSFGKPFGFLDAGEDVRGILPALAGGTAFLVGCSVFSSWAWLVLTRPAQKMMALMGDKGPALFIKFASQLVDERLLLKETDKDSFDERQDMLSHFLRATDPSTKKPLHYGRVMNECSTLVVAGADTTKTATIAFIQHVYSNPATLEKLRAEIAAALEDGSLAFPVSYAQGSRLEYLQACVKEALRIHPAVGMTLQRVAPEGGAFVGGRFYRKGTLVGMSAWEIHHDPRAYGPDAAEWRPERWLEGEGKNDLQKYNLAFGQGSRVCIGKNISIMEMLKLLPSLVHHYDITFDNPDTPLKVNESWFTPQHDFHCHIRKRAVDLD